MSNVRQLFTPNANRIASVRRWFAFQAVSTDYAGALSIAITIDDRLIVSGCGVEPEHTEPLLDALHGLIKRLEGQLPTDRRQSAKVVPLRLVASNH